MARYVEERKEKKNWIAGAVKHPGALTKQAAKVDESPMAFASQHKHDSGKTGARSRLALTFSKMNKG